MIREIKKPAAKRRKSKNSRKNRAPFGVRIYNSAVIIFAVALAVAYLSVYINPRVMWLPMFFGLYFVPIALLNILLFILGILLRRATFLICLVALVPTLIYSDQFLKIGNEQQVSERDGVKIMTYNVGGFRAFGKGVSNTDVVQRVTSLIEEQNPDIVCIQECRVRDTAKLNTVLPGNYPYRHFHFFRGKSYFGNVTLSRFPIVGQETVTFPKSTNLFLRSDIKLGEGTVSVFNCHLESYSISFTSVVKKLSNRDQFADEFILLHEHIRDASLKRTEQVDKLAGMSAGSPYPSIICGDFNDTPVSYAYHTLSKDRKDSFAEAGSGFSSTYSALWPILRIDYVLVPDGVDVLEHSVTRIGLSDHYPVTTKIVLNDEYGN